MNKILISLPLMCVCVLLASCISWQTPPESWTRVTLENIDISGTYKNWGIDADGRRARLSLLLLPIWDIAYDRSIKHVSIEHDIGENLTIYALSDSGKEYRKTFSRTDDTYRINNEEIILKQRKSPILNKFIVGKTWGYLHLSMMNEKTLILRDNNKNLGFFSFIPLAEYNNSWFLFEKERP